MTVEKKPSKGANLISAGEITHRVAVIKRFKELLKAQRDRFSAYLEALDKQQDVIKQGSAEALLRHVELEERIVADIYSIQKVIDPLEKMYQTVKSDSQPMHPVQPDSEKHSADEEVSNLKDALEGLKVEAIIRSERNRTLLSKRMTELRSEIKSLRNNPYMRRRENNVTPTQIDIRG